MHVIFLIYQIEYSHNAHTSCPLLNNILARAFFELCAYAYNAHCVRMPTMPIVCVCLQCPLCAYAYNAHCVRMPTMPIVCVCLQCPLCAYAYNAHCTLEVFIYSWQVCLSNASTLGFNYWYQMESRKHFIRLYCQQLFYDE